MDFHIADAFDDLRVVVELRAGDEPVPTAMTITALVNGDPMPDFLAPCAVLASIRESGRHPLFTCGCGTFGCGGYWVAVECTADAWIWRNGCAPHPDVALQRLVHRFHYRFSWDQVRDVLDQIRDGFAAIETRWPATRPFVGRCGQAYLSRPWRTAAP